MEKTTTTVSDAELLRRIDQMAMELERLRQQVVELTVAKRRRKRLKSVREYEFFGMWANREGWQGLSTEECLAQIREKAWGEPFRWKGEAGGNNDENP